MQITNTAIRKHMKKVKDLLRYCFLMFLHTLLSHEAMLDRIDCTIGMQINSPTKFMVARRDFYVYNFVAQVKMKKWKRIQDDLFAGNAMTTCWSKRWRNIWRILCSALVNYSITFNNFKKFKLRRENSWNFYNKILEFFSVKVSLQL